MPTRFRHARLHAFIFSALATGFTGFAGAQSATPPDNDAAFRANIPNASTRSPVHKQHHMPSSAVVWPDDHSNRTRTPIKHVILLIGENRTFDHVYATYTPPAGQQVRNLISEGIVNANGTPGPNVAAARQWQANDSESYSIAPTHTTPYTQLPSMNTGGAPTQAPFASPQQAEAVEPALPLVDYYELATGGTGLPNHVIDTRFPLVLSNAPVDAHASISYNDYANSPVHRFFQMWQQLDCDASAATLDNLSGCRNDLFPWIETTIGAGNNGKPQPAKFTDETTGEGATSAKRP